MQDLNSSDTIATQYEDADEIGICLDILDGSQATDGVLTYTAGVFSNYADGIVNVDLDTCAAFAALSDKLPYVG